MSDTIARANPGDLGAGTGLSFRAALNADRTILYAHVTALEHMIEAMASMYTGKGTMPGNAAELYINTPTAGRVYCPVDYYAVITGVPVRTEGILSQAYEAAVLNHVFLVVSSAGALSLRVSQSATEAANELWIADVSAVPAIDNAPAGKAFASISLGTGADGTLAGKLGGIYQVLTTSATPDAENTIAHGLGRTPIGYVVVKSDKAGDVYTGTTGWGTTNIYLKATVASMAVTILIF